MGAGRLAPAQRNNFVKKMLKFIAVLELEGEGGRGRGGINSIYRRIEEITLIENICRPAGLESFYFCN